MTMEMRGRRVLVTGGASFIGSNLSEALLKRGAEVTIADDLSSGKLENITDIADDVRFEEGTLHNPGFTWEVMQGQEIVFHLAADHGGRGYVDLHQVACANNMGMDQLVFDIAHQSDVEKVVYASSGCVYPNHLQADIGKSLYLTEDQVGPPYDADNMYGWAKLMAEMTLRAYAQETAMKTASARYFTVYGPRGKIDHAIMALLGRAYVLQDPFVIWGDGKQIRNWTYVDDIVEGTIRCAEVLDDGSAVNLGTMERNTVREAAEFACKLASHTPTFDFQTHMPVGPVNRVADNELAFEILDWVPAVLLEDGMTRTWEWITDSWDPDLVREELTSKLTER